MNIDFIQFLRQAAALCAWVFVAAAIYALIEKVILATYPQWLHIEEAGASQPPDQRVDTVTPQR